MGAFVRPVAGGGAEASALLEAASTLQLDHSAVSTRFSDDTAPTA
jgi:hypothetical protein